jgi:hypothetical protein
MVFRIHDFFNLVLTIGRQVAEPIEIIKGSAAGSLERAANC